MTRILLVDDHQIMREGLMSLMAGEPDLEVVGDASDGRQAVQLAKRLKPDLVVMDISMPGLSGIEATRQILNELDRVRVLALSMHADPRFVAGALEAGAHGYMIKDCTSQELLECIRTVAGGGTYLSPQVAEVVVKGFVRRLGEETGTPPASVLTPREREVLQLLVEGHTVKAIAERIHLGVKTVETHRRNIMEKLGLKNLVDLIKYAMREGVVSLDEWLSS
ncbi:LuxR family transcriptional regulator [Desulfocarbo indianensis]|nr:LuxR family transcriptional regulator [Desulfocarbo indianensis]